MSNQSEVNREIVLEVASDNPNAPLKEIAKETGLTTNRVRGILKSNKDELKRRALAKKRGNKALFDMVEGGLKTAVQTIIEKLNTEDLDITQAAQLTHVLNPLYKILSDKGQEHEAIDEDLEEAARNEIRAIVLNTLLLSLDMSKEQREELIAGLTNDLESKQLPVLVPKPFGELFLEIFPQDTVTIEAEVITEPEEESGAKVLSSPHGNTSIRES